MLCVLCLGWGSGEEKVPGRENLLGSSKPSHPEVCAPARQGSNRVSLFPKTDIDLVEEVTGWEMPFRPDSGKIHRTMGKT